jgi:hypothetical protein
MTEYNEKKNKRGQDLILAFRKIEAKNLENIYSLGIYKPTLPLYHFSKHQTYHHTTLQTNVTTIELFKTPNLLSSNKILPSCTNKRRIKAIAVELKCFYDISGMHE